MYSFFRELFLVKSTKFRFAIHRRSIQVDCFAVVQEAVVRSKMKCRALLTMVRLVSRKINKNFQSLFARERPFEIDETIPEYFTN